MPPQRRRNGSPCTRGIAKETCAVGSWRRRCWNRRWCPSPCFLFPLQNLPARSRYLNFSLDVYRMAVLSWSVSGVFAWTLLHARQVSVPAAHRRDDGAAEVLRVQHPLVLPHQVTRMLHEDFPAVFAELIAVEEARRFWRELDAGDPRLHQHPMLQRNWQQDRRAWGGHRCQVRENRASARRAVRGTGRVLCTIDMRWAQDSVHG